MPIHFERSRRRSWLPSAVAVLAIFAAAVALLWSINDEPQATAASRAIQTTTGEIKAINDSLASQRRDIKVLFDQFSALTARLSVLQEDTATILRNTSELAERLKATQTQMVQDNAMVAEQLKAISPTARDRVNTIAQAKDGNEQVASIVANLYEENPEFRPPLPQPRPIARRKFARRPQPKLQQ